MKLSANCKLALKGLALASSQDHYLSFKAISENADIPLYLVRRSVRLLARKGLAKYAKGLWTDDGEPAGAGYKLTELGWQLVQHD